VTEAEEEPTSEQEEEIEKNRSIVSKAQERLTDLTSRANVFVQNQIVPAAHQAIATGQPVAITIGKKTFKLAVAMAREVITNPLVQAGIVYGFFQPNEKEYETWTHMLSRFMDAVSEYPSGVFRPTRFLAPRPLTEYERFIRLLKNMYDYGAYGASFSYKYTWVLTVAKLIYNDMEIEEGHNPNATKAVLKNGMKSLQNLYNIYDYIGNPISTIARTATRALVSHIAAPLLRPAQTQSDSDHDPAAASSNEPPASAPASSSAPASASAPVRRRLPKKSDPPDIHRSTPGRTKIKGKKNIQTHLNQRAGSGMPAMTPALVNYAAGVKQSKRGGGKTIQGLAPILEFNEAADDPYLMRQQAH
jgi:hypothetical protein